MRAISVVGEDGQAVTEVAKMPGHVNLKLLTACDWMEGEDEEESALLKSMLEEALAYVASFSWGSSVLEKYIAYGVGGVLALFLFRFGESGQSEEWRWVVVGDLPPVHFLTTQASDRAAALRAYCDMMDAWSMAILANKPIAGLFPVRAAATRENAEMLQSRIGFIRSQILPDVT
jgi:hypothetical protein